MDDEAIGCLILSATWNLSTNHFTIFINKESVMVFSVAWFAIASVPKWKFLRNTILKFQTMAMQFVDEKVQWMHIDLAGPVWNDKKRTATGFGVSTLVEWVVKNSS